MTFWRRETREAELDEEVRTHLNMAAQTLTERGVAQKEAERAAKREFGNVELTKEVTRDAWGGRWLAKLNQRRAVRLADVVEEPRLHRDRRPHTGAGHWLQQRCFFVDRRLVAAEPRRSGPPGVGPNHLRSAWNRRTTLQPDVRPPSRAAEGVHRHFCLDKRPDGSEQQGRRSPHHGGLRNWLGLSHFEAQAAPRPPANLAGRRTERTLEWSCCRDQRGLLARAFRGRPRCSRAAHHGGRRHCDHRWRNARLVQWYYCRLFASGGAALHLRCSTSRKVFLPLSIRLHLVFCNGAPRTRRHFCPSPSGPCRDCGRRPEGIAHRGLSENRLFTQRNAVVDSGSYRQFPFGEGLRPGTLDVADARGAADDHLLRQFGQFATFAHAEPSTRTRCEERAWGWAAATGSPASCGEYAAFRFRRSGRHAVVTMDERAARPLCGTVRFSGVPRLASQSHNSCSSHRPCSAHGNSYWSFAGSQPDALRTGGDAALRSAASCWPQK